MSLSNFHYRFIIAILTLTTINFSLLLANCLILYDSFFAQLIASIIVPIAAFFSYEWSLIHSSALTRKIRAFWDERNILQTYQPRARFAGQKFKPDPPTPGPGLPPLLEGGCIGQAKINQEDQVPKEKRESFEHDRNAHYANEFNVALKGETAENKKFADIDSLAAASSPLVKIDNLKLKPVVENNEQPSIIKKDSKQLNEEELKEKEKK